jgi:glycosyltransferase involved in cell wall biosynthesis
MQNDPNPNPLVSICIPVFNGEKTIQKTIDSVINQTYKNLEIIIVDNCSTDSTVDIVQKFRDSRIRLILNDTHFPCGELNWNRCFQYVHGEFMAIFHADDIYLPQMVSRQVEAFKKFPQVGSVFTRGNIINERDEIIRDYFTPLSVKKMYPYSYPELMPLMIEYGDFLMCPSAMLRTEIYQKIAPFRYEEFQSASDFDMWLRAAEYGSIMVLSEKLIHYRISQNQGTFILNYLRTHEADSFKVCDYHINANRGRIQINDKIMCIYQISRFCDQLFCARNYLLKHDMDGFKTSFAESLDKTNIKLMIRHPLLSKQIYRYLIKIGISFVKYYIS